MTCPNIEECVRVINSTYYWSYCDAQVDHLHCTWWKENFANQEDLYKTPKEWHSKFKRGVSEE